MFVKEELQEIINKLTSEQLNTAKSFLEWLASQKQKTLSTNRISLKGIIEGSPVKDQDFEEAKRIWQLP